MKKFRVILIYVVVIACVFLVLNSLNVFGGNIKAMEYQSFLKEVRAGNIGKVKLFDGDNYLYVWKTSSQTEPATATEPAKFPEKADYQVTIQSYDAFSADMSAIYGDGKTTVSSDEYTFAYEFVPDPGESILLYLLPYILLAGVVVFFIITVNRAQSSANGTSTMGFSKSRAKMQTNSKVKFTDVAGADEEKEELREIVDFLRYPDKFAKNGARIPKGVLLVGPPGTGKTLLAKAVAGEANVPFYSISGSDFVELFVGVGASRVRDLFVTAKKTAPAIVFIDEIDAVGRQRGAGLGGGNDEREQTLNQLLVEMDGFEGNEGIIVIAATNRPDILDPALLRPGRFDRRVTVNVPDIKGREEILQVHARNKHFADDVSFSDVAKSTPGFTGADLENMLNEAAILATRHSKTLISAEELNEAATRVIMGPEKRSRLITPEDKKITAYHEAGHAVAALSLKNCDPLREISIIPRGQAAGYTMTMPGNELAHMSKSRLLDQIAMMLGGRAAEEVMLGDICTGAYNDLKQATSIARLMVTDYGMSDAVGPLFLGGDTEVFVGRDFGQHSNVSEEYTSIIDGETRAIIEAQYKRIKEIILTHREAVIRVCDTLIRREYMTGAQFERIYNGDNEDEVFPKKLDAAPSADAADDNTANDKT